MKQIRLPGSDHTMPALGLGTWTLEGPECVEAVRHALELGYPHIDTARMYQNEEEVGRGLREAGVDREEIFLTTKIWWEDLSPARLLAATDESLKELATDYVDLLLIHWPSKTVPLDKSLAALQELQEAGKIRHLGVSNFPPGLLERAVELAPVACNQVEYHPFLSQDRLLDVARRHDVAITAYSPLAQGEVMEDDTLRALAQRHGRTPAQIALRWLVQQDGVAAVPRASSAEHRDLNLDILDFELGEDEMKRIFALSRGRRLIDPDFAPDWAA